MLTRRAFAHRIGFAAAGVPLLHEAAFAQRALVKGDLPKDMVWLNANENPEGPPAASIRAMTEAAPISGRYNYQEFGDFYAALAHSEDLQPEQILVGAGSTEVLHCAVEAFTSPTRPLIMPEPTYEAPPEFTRNMGHPVVRVPLRGDFTADVKKLVEEAGKARGGIIYICNPNNPTAAATSRQDLAWMVSNLPANTVLLVDEAYLHFADSPDVESALGYVRQGKDVVVTRTFSKVYGMAGVRAGFACARPELIQKMQPFRNNVISILAVRAVLAAIAEAKTLVPERRARLIAIRKEMCGWLRQKGLRYIEPQANFMMIDIGRDVREIGPTLARRGVAVGRPFPPLDRMMRVTIGTDREMARFREVFWGVYQG
jgi:histidinol-phosphate aminotransferase